MISSVRLADENDIKDWYGKVPATMRAIILEINGDPMMICGVIHGVDHYMAFMDMKTGAQKYPIAIMKATRAAIMDVFQHYKQPIFAIVDDELDSAPRYLERIGFSPLDGNENVVVFIPPNISRPRSFHTE